MLQDGKVSIISSGLHLKDEILYHFEIAIHIAKIATYAIRLLHMRLFLPGRAPTDSIAELSTNWLVLK